MKTKIYTNGEVVYGYSLNSKKWEFKVESVALTFLTPCPGRGEMAAKIANVIRGAIKRCGQLDNLARKNIAQLVAN